MTKIVCFSDIHGQFKSKILTKWFYENPADILLFAGDLQSNDFDSGGEFLEWASGLPYDQKVFVFGNHDGNYQKTLDAVKDCPSIKFLNNESISVDGINIFGSPYSVRFGNWWFMKPDNELFKMYRSIPNNTNILLTHTPAFNILDTTYDGCAAGSRALLARIGELTNLKCHVFGHIHEGHGQKMVGNVQFINAAVLDERYRLAHLPTVINYN